MAPHADEWLTIRIRFQRADFSPLDVPEELAALIAMETTVGGVETLSSPARSRPELVVYADPSSRVSLFKRIETLSEAMGIDIEMTPEVHRGEAWRDAWRRFYRSTVFGAGALLLRPSWIPRRPGDPSREIVLDPGRAFGTGLHASTRLCLERLCALSHRAAPARVLDLGCGSGVLGLAAARLWPACEVFAVDVDPDATSTARENAAANHVAARFHVCTGPIEALLRERGFELVLANIRPDVLRPLAPALATRVVPGGRAILSGILDREAPSVATRYAGAGWRVDTQTTEQDWVALDVLWGTA